MKFAKDLANHLYPEWEYSYIDYKTGKKKIKAISQAIEKGNRGGRTPSFRNFAAIPRNATHTVRQRSNTHNNSDGPDPDDVHPRATSTATPNRRSFRSPGSRFADNTGSYRSITGSPPLPSHENGSDGAEFWLPKAALDHEDEHAPSDQDPDEHDEHDEHEDSKPSSPVNPQGGSLGDTGSLKRSPTLLRRVFSHTNGDAEIEKRQAEFFEFLDNQLNKVDTFYREREREKAVKLMQIARQLDIMRRSRTEEYQAQQAIEQQQPQGTSTTIGSRIKGTFTGRARFGKNTRALAAMATPRIPAQENGNSDSQRDYTRRMDTQNTKAVPYRQAKHKLTRALHELYQHMEKLKSFADMNREGFRKIIKKYNKAVNDQPIKAKNATGKSSIESVDELLNEASFAKTRDLERLMSDTEDLYAQFFEGQDRKIAASKLRRNLKKKTTDYTRDDWIAAVLGGIGGVLAIWALTIAVPRLQAGGEKQVETSYLLQIYGGYFLILFHFFLFCGICIIWANSRINYGFVFEYDSMKMLNWRQLATFPAGFMFALGLCMLVNFRYTNSMYIYWPVILMGVSVLIVFLPAPMIYHHSRKWWAFTNWRLLVPWLYTVEFRDVFLGDMYCSHSYVFGNIELFFCLYAHGWNSPQQCNSSHSWLLGFFTCVPSALRACQCICRYLDQKKAYPHLANLGKYVCGILYYATLSMYRIHKQPGYQKAFIFCAALNSVVTTAWDVLNDWSLGNLYSTKHWLLRETLTFRRVWVYYVAAVFDLIIRFNWIFYIIFAADIQHSAFLSFIVSLTEVFRRGVWSIFRVENEHCENVRLARGYKEIDLPYDDPEFPAVEGTHQDEIPVVEGQQPSPGEAESGRRARSTLVRIGNLISSAHMHDFERRSPPAHFLDNFLRNAIAHDFEHSTEEWSDSDSDAN